jgi:hypothetical protein
MLFSFIYVVFVSLLKLVIGSRRPARVKDIRASSTASCASTSITTTASARTGRSPDAHQLRPLAGRSPVVGAAVKRSDRLGGLVHEYYRAAA